jgi:transposase InsO family protein
MAEVYANPNQEASTVAETLVANFSCRFGIPRELHSDQGRNFESHMLQEVLQRLGVSKTRTMTLHPQSDGMVEHFIKTINILRTQNHTDGNQFM